jgi:hypothetical protein
LNIYKRLQECRVLLQNTNLKKSGKNGHLGFSYFSLDDFIGVVNKLFLDHDLFSAFNIITTADGIREAELVIYYQPSESNDVQSIRFTSPIADAGLKGSTAIQSLGAVHTYMRRYLYLNALEIAEPEVLDYVCGSDMIENKLDEKLMTNATELGIDINKVATYYKKDVTALTNEELTIAINKKMKEIARKKAQENANRE